MVKSKTVRVTEEELALLQTLRKDSTQGHTPITSALATGDNPAEVSAAQQSLADAFVSAIERTRPVEKKTIANRKVNTPWTPKDGSPQLTLKRKMFQHGIPIINRVSNEEIDLLNKVRPGNYCEGFVRVTVRKDRGLDIDYPVRTASQRLRLVNQFGINSLVGLLQRIVDEHANPTKYKRAEDMEIYE